MTYTYEQFLKKYLPQALILQDERQKAEFLCYVAHQQAQEKNLQDTDIFVLLRKLTHEEKNGVPSSYRSMKRIFGKQVEYYDVEKIKLQELLDMLTPTLHQLHLLNGIIVALNVLGWENPNLESFSHAPIAKFLNELFEPFEARLKAVKMLGEVESILDEFRSIFSSQVCEIDKFGTWLSEVAKRRTDVLLRCEAFVSICEFCYRPADTRFARKDQKYGLLRDRWSNYKELIYTVLETELKTLDEVLK